jgi:hypothetical protein
MKLKDKLKKTGRNSAIAKFIIFLVIIYLFIAMIKGLYFLTNDSSYSFVSNINLGLEWLIEKSYIFPLSIAWDKIPEISLEAGNILEIYKIITPPVVVIILCAFFIKDHLLVKAEFDDLKAEIKKEKALRDMRKDEGLEIISENNTLDVVINNATNSDPSWHEKWWGKIAIGLAIMLIATVVGLR